MAGKKLYKAAKKAAKQLDMSQAARMKRAREMGFDVDRVYYHGTTADFDAFERGIPLDADGYPMVPYNKNPNTLLGPHFATDPGPANRFVDTGKQPKWLKDQGRQGSAKIIPAHVRGKLKKVDSEDQILRMMDEAAPFDDILADVADEWGLVDWDNEIAIENGVHLDDARDAYFGRGYLIDDPDAFRLQVDQRRADALAEKLQGEGFAGIEYPNEFEGGDAITVFDPANIRSINAAFDPEKAGSSNILASLAGAGVVGAGLLGSEDADAAESTFNASPEELKAAAERFAMMRRGKGWSGLKDAIATLASAVGGGLVGDASRLGGYLNPFISPEETEAGAQWLEQKMRYVPDAPNVYLEGLGRGMEQFGEDLQPIIGGWEESIPGQVYERLPERVQGLLRVGSDLLL